MALSAVRITTVSSDAARTATIWRATEFADLIEQFKKSERFKGAVAIQSLLKQIVALAGGPAPKVVGGGKRKNAEEEQGEKEEKAPKGKKAKKAKKAAEVEVEVEEEQVEEAEEVAEVVAKSPKKAKKEKKDKERKRDKGTEKS